MMPFTSCLVLFSKTAKSCSASRLQPYHALLLKIAQKYPTGPLHPCLSFALGTTQTCPSGSRLEATASVLHYAVMPHCGHCTGFPDSADYPSRVSHSSLSYTLHYLNELFSLPITQSMRKMHRSRPRGFLFDVLPSRVNCRKRYTDRS